MSDELPHSIAVTVDDMIEREDKHLLEIYANVYVERDSQKGIIIGKGGARLKEVGATARAQIEGAPRAQGVPRVACEGREGLAARSQAARAPGF